MKAKPTRIKRTTVNYALLQKRQRALGVSTREIARRINDSGATQLTNWTVSNIISGKTRSPGIEHLTPIATVLGLTLDEVLIHVDPLKEHA